MKVQNKTPGIKLNKDWRQARLETSNILDAKFKTQIIRMLDKLSEDFNSLKKDMKTIKKNQSKIKDKLTEMKNTGNQQ